MGDLGHESETEVRESAKAERWSRSQQRP